MSDCIAKKLLKISMGSGDYFPEVSVLCALKASSSRVFSTLQVISGLNCRWYFD